MTGNKWISINTTNVHRNTSEMILLLEKFLSYDNFILGWIYSHTTIAKSRVPWRDDLVNVKILFSCWPKYLYTHIWPQNIEKWGKTVILLVKWRISNFRPPSGGPFFRCLRHRPGVRQIIPPKSDTCVPQKPKMHPDLSQPIN